MRKLSKIIESIWSDMQDRSSGDVVRKEDEFKSICEYKRNTRRNIHDNNKLW